MKLLGGILIFIIMIAVAFVRLNSAPAPSSPPPQAAAPQETHNNLYYPRFTEAHWGHNCNGMPVMNLLGVPDQGRHYAVKKNNALQAFKDACGQQSLCRVALTPRAMRFDPAPNCKKALELTYRCFSFDALRRLSLPADAQEAVIDCRSKEGA